MMKSKSILGIALRPHQGFEFREAEGVIDGQRYPQGGL